MNRFILLLLVTGCSKQEPAQNTTTTTGSTASGVPTNTTGTPGGTLPTYTPDCADGVSGRWPADGAFNVYYRTSIEWTLSPLPAGDEVLLVTDGAGASVPGVMHYEGELIEFTPDEPLAPSTTYFVALEDCPPSVSSFETSPTGDAVDPSTAIGTTYALDIQSGRWLQPSGVGSLLGAYLTVDVLTSVQDADQATIHVLGGVSEEGTSAQDLCSETVAFPIADFTQNPFFELGPADISIGVLGTSIQIYDLYLSGSLRSDLLGIEGAELEGILDTRGVVPLVDPYGPDDVVCQLMAGFGVTCQACPQGGDFCVPALVDDLIAPAVAGPLVERSSYDILLDPLCP